ncbi:aldo/keto reductase [Mycobacterium yunnanensis]|uniref:Aldo/keto reductase n=1 Tax=Mycobacterium yunnanensis TaxID=368477 RepID=A0A9X3BZP2_9MYCO|nr:aldo/keto reductase [Mycobacterium yunnanensis]MCV7419106.1 aldo/keto reductase [Mycobacterium yunnanensis]
MTNDQTVRLGLGLAALGRPAYITSGRADDVGAARSVDEMRDRTADVLDAAYSSGIRYVDVARSYGLAEQFLAHWLASRPEIEDVEVASKWGYRYVGDWQMTADVHEVKDHSLDAFTRQLAETKQILGDRVDLYQVHSVTPDSPVLADRELHRALADVRDGGLRIGLSTSGPRQADVVRAATAIEAGGRRLFTSVQSTWNLLETSAGSALSEARAEGMAVVVKEVFANGRLAPGSTDVAPGVELASRVAADLGIGLDQLALAAAYRQPWSPRVLSGAATPLQVRSHVAGADFALPTDVADALEAAAEDPADYWAARGRRQWG